MHYNETNLEIILLCHVRDEIKAFVEALPDCMDQGF